MVKKFAGALIMIIIASNMLNLIIGFSEAQPVVDPEALYKSKSFYEAVEDVMLKLSSKYAGAVTLENIGESAFGRDIKGMRIGKGTKEVFINASHHGREYMTTILVLSQMEMLLDAYAGNKTIDGYNVRQLLDEVSIYFVPLVNPDGVEIARGTVPIPGAFKSKIARVEWKSNGNGVDLNRNYSANWYAISSRSAAGATDFRGGQPFSEPETAAVKELVAKHNFETALCYHAAGNYIYWYSGQKGDKLERDRDLAAGLSKVSGYELEKADGVPGGTGEDVSPAGGMKDWFVNEYGKPGFTVEIGSKVDGRLILPYKEFDSIWKANNIVPLILAANFSTSKDNEMEEEPAAAGTASEIKGIVVGTVLNQVDKAKTVKLYDRPEGKALTNIPLGSKLKVLALAFDGWYKVLAPDYSIAYVDSRYVAFDSRFRNPMLTSSMFMNKKVMTDHIIIVNQSTQTIMVYRKDGTNGYKQVIKSAVSTGKDVTPTPNGWYTVKRTRGVLGYAPKYKFYMPYYVQLKGGYLIHGLPLDKNRKEPPELAEKLGEKDSHGCVRLPTQLAKYIYDNVKENNLVIIDNAPPSIEEVLRLIKENS